MTANTAAQWSQVSDQLSAQQSEAERIRALADAELAKITLENGNAPSQSVTQATVAAGISTAQAQDLQAQTQSAAIQIARASAAEPGTTTVPAPANFSPGNNTDVSSFQPASQLAATVPSNTEITARRVVLPSRPQVEAQTFETEVSLPEENPRPGPVEIIPFPTVQQMELPPLSSPEEISGQFDGVSIPVISRPQQTLVDDTNLSLAPSELPIAAPSFDEFAGVDEAIAAQEGPPVINPPFDEFAGVDAQARRIAEENAALGELRINTNLPSISVVGGIQQSRSSNQIVQKRKSTDWRFRISISNDANYLYKDPVITQNDGEAKNHLLYPLSQTDGVIFPYTPKIDVTYQANYDPVEVTHSNYKFYNYKNSSVENIQISGDFTAQDTYEANYLLAVIHFFRSVTKMFYGKDNDPARGVPPPICYLTGHGTYAFNYHPCVITSFSLNYPIDVDYVNARIPTGELNNSAAYNKPTIGGTSRTQRLINLTRTGVNVGGTRVDPVFRNITTDDSQLTRVPSKLTITIGALPVVTRNDVSNNFSLKNYSSGALLLSTRPKNNGRKSVGGFW